MVSDESKTRGYTMNRFLCESCDYNTRDIQDKDEHEKQTDHIMKLIAFIGDR